MHRKWVTMTNTYFFFSGLNSRFLHDNDVFLSCRVERGNGMESQNCGLCPRPLIMNLFSQNGEVRNLGEFAYWLLNYSFKFNCCKKVTC